MKLDEAYIKKLQPKIAECLEDFASCKKEIIESRELIAQRIEDTSLWMRYRNALDRLATVQLGIVRGEFPPSNNPKIMEGEEDPPEKILEYSSYLFRNTAVEAWVQATENLLGLLRIRIDSREWFGDKNFALQKLEEAIKIEAEARQLRSPSMKATVFKYRQVADKANDGLKVLTMKKPYTRWSFYVLILTIVILIVIEAWRWFRGV